MKHPERPFLASMGIYVFKYAALDEILKENPAWVDFGREIIPEAIKRLNVQAFLFNDYWEDIGTISAFYKANLDMTSPLPKFNFFDAETPIYTRARYLPGSKVENCKCAIRLSPMAVLLTAPKSPARSSAYEAA
ncbi:MAG: sugar phosphate nucleotidyltransferase [Pyrinomonadaceae bacterium]